METKDKWPKVGDKMKFLGCNGYNSELAAALKVLEVGQVLTVQKICVGDWSHSIRFEEVEGSFNGVMFEWLQDLPVAEIAAETKEQKPWYQGVSWKSFSYPRSGVWIKEVVPDAFNYPQVCSIGSCYSERVVSLIAAAPETATQRDKLLSVQKQLVEALEELRWVGNDLRERKAARAKADAAIQAAKASS